MYLPFLIWLQIALIILLAAQDIMLSRYAMLALTPGCSLFATIKFLIYIQREVNKDNNDDFQVDMIALATGRHTWDFMVHFKHMGLIVFEEVNIICINLGSTGVFRIFIALYVILDSWTQCYSVFEILLRLSCTIDMDAGCTGCKVVLP